MEEEFIINSLSFWSDGACQTASNVGAFALKCPELKIMVVPRSEVNTTNNRMELLAIIRMLELIYKMPEQFLPKECTIFTDSMYVIGHLTKNWKWKNNEDLRDEINYWMKEIRNKNITTKFKFELVKGHSGILNNEVVDHFATYRTNHDTRSNN